VKGERGRRKNARGEMRYRKKLLATGLSQKEKETQTKREEQSIGSGNQRAILRGRALSTGNLARIEKGKDSG